MIGAGFSLELASGRGILRLKNREVGEGWLVDLRLSLPLPKRFDLSGGARGFRHHRAKLEEITVTCDDRVLSRNLSGGRLRDVQVRAVEGLLLVWGNVVEPDAESDLGVPFFARARIEPLAQNDNCSILLSFFDTHIFGATSLSAPLLAAELIDRSGVTRVGATAAVFEPLNLILRWTLAPLGWKLPDRSQVRLLSIKVEAGQVKASFGEGAAAVMRPAPRRFIEDYESKALYSAVESTLGEGSLDEAYAEFERHLELYPDHRFLNTRLLQLGVSLPGKVDEAAQRSAQLFDVLPIDAPICHAQALVQLGYSREAAGLFEQIAAQIAAVDTLESSLAKLGAALVWRSIDAARARKLLLEVIEFQRHSKLALRALVDLAHSSGEFEASLDYALRLAELEENSQIKSQIYEKAGDSALSFSATKAELAYECALKISANPAEILVKLAHCRALADDFKGARSLCEQALAELPDCTSAWIELVEIALQQGELAQAQSAISSLLQVLARVQDQELRGEMALRLGRILEEPAPELAIAHYQKALSGESAEVEAALAALERLYGMDGGDRPERPLDWARDLEIARTSSSKERAARLSRLAQVYAESLDDLARAESLLEEAAALEPDEIRYLEEQRPLLRELNDSSKLTAVLQKLSERIVDQESLASIHLERAALLPDQEALTAYTLALGCHPDWPPALFGLEALYQRMGRDADRYLVLCQLAACLEGDEAAEIWEEAAELAEDLGRDSSHCRAQARLAAGESLESIEPEPDKIVEEIQDSEEPASSDDFSELEPAKAVSLEDDFSELDALEPAHERDLQSEIAQLESQAMQAEGEDAAELWLMVAEMHRDREHNPDAAILPLERALALSEPGSDVWMETLEILEDLREVAGDMDGLLALYERRRAVSSPSEVELLRATVLRRMGRLEEALAAAQLAEGEQALELAVAVAVELNRPNEAVEILLNDLADLGKRDAGYRLWRAAGLLEETSATRALELYCEAGIRLDDAEFIEDWVRFSRVQNDRPSLAQALVAQAKSLQSARNGKSAMQAPKISRLYFEASQLVDSPEAARPLLESSVAAWDENVEALDALSEVLKQLGDRRGLIELLQAQIELALPGEFRGELYAQVAEQALELGELAEAREALELAKEDFEGDMSRLDPIVAALEASTKS